MGRPAPVRIQLSNPTFAADVQEQLDSIGALAGDCPLESEGLTRAACEQTGLDDFGDPRFEEPLGVICRALREEGDLSAAGSVLLFSQLVGLLRNRLRLEELYRRHPEIEDVPLERPIIIAGQPRTGTTVLQNLLATDSSLRHLPNWESIEPIPVPDEKPLDGGLDPRLLRARDALGFMNSALPHLKKIHPMEPQEPHEEIQLLAMDFSTMMLESFALTPSYRDWYKSTDQTLAYTYLRRVLKALSWLDLQRGLPIRRWLLKSPQHTEQLPVLRSVFPDAAIVLTHRDPLSVTRSVATMTAYLSWLYVDAPDAARFGEYWSARCEDLFRGCVEGAEIPGRDRFLNVRFHEFMGNEVETAERVYEFAGHPFPDSVRARMVRFMSEHPRGRLGTVEYDLTQLGIDADERSEALGFYADRFGVELER